MTSVKFDYEDQVRRTFLSEGEGALTFSKLLGTVKTLFPSLKDKSIELSWVDEEGDEISFSTDGELREAVRVLSAGPNKTLRFSVRVSDASESSAPKAAATASANLNVVHTNITCDECGMSPIVGIRYKCTVRENFDLCAGCEAKKVQPYPMVKIYDPDHHPSVLLYAFNEPGERPPHHEGPPPHERFRGCWRRGMRPPHGGPHGPHHQPPFGVVPPMHHPYGPPPHHPHGPGPHGPHGPPPPPFGGCGNRQERKAERVERKMEKLQSKLNNLRGSNGNGCGEGAAAGGCPLMKSPFVAAMDAFLSATAVHDEDTASVSAPEATASVLPGPVDAEDQLMQEAIAESLTINAAKYVPSAAPANPALPKPALRFVKDVTYPDGSAVAPNATFHKVWHVRNDGAKPWPEGCVLATAGGDMMTADDTTVPLPVLNANDEADLSVDLTAPSKPGLYTSYYRAKTREGQNFGQRLWASIRVEEPNEDVEWDVVATKVDTGVGASPPPATVELSSATATAAPVNVPMVEETPTPAPAPAPVLSDRDKELQSLALIWRRELEVLGDMGFVDLDVLLPLLQRHLGSPLSLAADKTAKPNVEGMQRIVMALLSGVQEI